MKNEANNGANSKAVKPRKDFFSLKYLFIALLIILLGSIFWLSQVDWSFLTTNWSWLRWLLLPLGLLLLFLVFSGKWSGAWKIVKGAILPIIGLLLIVWLCSSIYSCLRGPSKTDDSRTNSRRTEQALPQPTYVTGTLHKGEFHFVQGVRYEFYMGVPNNGCVDSFLPDRSECGYLSITPVTSYAGIELSYQEKGGDVVLWKIGYKNFNATEYLERPQQILPEGIYTVTSNKDFTAYVGL